MPQFDTTPIPYVEIGTQAAAVRTAIDAARLSAANSFGGLQKLAIPGPFATDAEANTFGVPDDNLYYRSDGTVRAASHISLDLAFALDKTLTARTGPTPTFTRASGATYVGSDGLIHGIDTSTTSVTFGTGSKTVTLSAPLGQDQMWRVGDEVEIVNSAGALMFGTVTSYTASTQELVCNITSNTGTGTFTAWRIGYRGARFDHDPVTGVCKGLLIEEQRTNLLLRSNEFSTATWGKATTSVAEVAGAGLDGGSAWRLTPSSANSDIGQSITVAAATTYTFSVWLKSDTGSNITLQLNIYDNISTTQRGTKTITVTPQWQRFDIAASSVGANSTRYIIGAFNSWSTGENILAWGAQVEAGAFPTSYIPTTSGTAARSADVCSIIGTDFSSFYNQSEGTAVAKVTNALGVESNAQYPFSFSGASSANLLIAYRVLQSSLKIGRFASIGSSSDTLSDSENAGTLSDGATDIIGFAIKLNDFAGSLDGNLITNNTVTLPTVDRMFIGSRLDGTRYWNGHIARIQYFRKRLSNEKLQALTAP